MRSAKLATLEAKIIKPGIEKSLEPLLHFRGHANLGRVHRLWNHVIAAKESDCESIGQLVKIVHDADYSQLCGPEKRIQNTSMYGFLSRICLTPQIAGLEPGLVDYANFLLRGRVFELQRVDATAERARCAWWRTFTPRPRRIAKPRVLKERDNFKPYQHAYPFIVHEGGKPENDLVRLVNDAVPKHLPPDFRADICQDLIVAILSGDVSRDCLTLPANEFTKRMFKMFPAKYGHMSLDAEIPGTEGMTLLDRIGVDFYDQG